MIHYIRSGEFYSFSSLYFEVFILLRIARFSDSVVGDDMERGGHSVPPRLQPEFGTFRLQRALLVLHIKGGLGTPEVLIMGKGGKEPTYAIAKPIKSNSWNIRRGLLQGGCGFLTRQ